MLVAVAAIVAFDIATPNPVSADHDCAGQRSCPHTDPTDTGWGGNVPGQMAEANRGRGGREPTPCWAVPDDEDEKGGLIVEEGEDGAQEGEVIWIYDDERNAQNQERAEPSEGIYLTRVCSLGDNVYVRHHLDETRCNDTMDPQLFCPANCDAGSQEWCQYGQATYEFDALAPQPLIEWWLAGENFERLVALPEPDFNPSEIAGIDGPATLVNFDTYLWVPDAGEDFIEESISVADVTLELEAQRGEYFVWDMGDGNIKQCPTPGIDPLADGLDHPDACTYSYPGSSARQSDERYHGNVSVEWVGIYTALVDGAVVEEEEHVVTATEPFEIGVAEAQAIIIR